MSFNFNRPGIFVQCTAHSLFILDKNKYEKKIHTDNVEVPKTHESNREWCYRVKNIIKHK